MHLGSLYAALGSYLSARAAGGRWLLRMDDLDPPREVPGAADTILRQLEDHGLTWDGAVLYQSQRSEAYRAALAQLVAGGWVFPCRCGRKDLRRRAACGIDGRIYPGDCRQRSMASAGDDALRFRIGDGVSRFVDRYRGEQLADRAGELGDFILMRRDGIASYPLAVVVDDAHQGVTEVVRGEDLLAATHRQRILQDALGLEVPDYGHLPTLLADDGDKLSKSEGAAALGPDPLSNLRQVLGLMGQQVPAAADRDALLAAAVQGWDPEALPQEAQRTV